MKIKFCTLLAVAGLLCTGLAGTAAAAIMQGLPCDKNCATSCDCSKCCLDNYNTFYTYSISGVTGNDWWDWFNAGQPDGPGCDETALVAWFATAVLCVLGGDEVLPCLTFAWMVYYIDLLLCYSNCQEGVCG